MTDFFIWYFNLDFFRTILFAFQALVLMALCAVPFTVSRVAWKQIIAPKIKQMTVESKPTRKAQHEP